MSKKKQLKNQSFDFDEVEKWLESYFLDPLTSYFDATQFQIDLYETEKEWIVEAILSDFETSEIKVYIEGNNLVISASKYPPSMKQQKRVRTINFPFLVVNQTVYATFSNGILEVFISKTDRCSGKNRYITMP
ncbi:Hsp20/alpha crystallin family protein [Neobacillus sp. SuZ13]|uniref:Hsp20/alpha crystallin family protein n=1 Tax=Neobacillus sp. SuZ13 TaxID=3047875 RepID=UPI0024C03908|nr:Hsp20/alpha crystallin family protein [Neobacillus sp. SuZ13]WHY64599.1 Hsp20/alpha crystallin family protein [Neobacillus sp. SuZ13]